MDKSKNKERLVAAFKAVARAGQEHLRKAKNAVEESIDNYDHEKTKKSLKVIGDESKGFLKKHRLDDVSKIKDELTDRVSNSRRKINRVYK